MVHLLAEPHTVNVRLSPEQILYTINHAEDDVILINSELLPLLQQIWDRVDAGKKLVLLSNDGKPTPAARTPLFLGCRIRGVACGLRPLVRFPGLR